MSDDLLHKLRIAAPGAVAGFVSGIAPDPRMPGVAGYWPGVTLGENVVALGGQLYDAGANISNKVFGTNLPMAPTKLAEAGDRAGETEQEIYQQVGGDPSITSTDEIIRGASSLAGGFLVPGLGLVRGLKAVAAGAGLGGGGTAALQAIRPEQEEPTIPASAFSGLDTPETTQPQQQPQRQQVVENTIPASAFSGMATDTESIPAGAFSGLSGGPVSAPAYSEVGQSDTTVWESLLTIGLAAAGLKAGKWAASHGARANETARQLRVDDPEYLVKANDYANTVARRKAGDTISDPQEVELPLPQAGKANQLGTKAMDYWLEAGSGLQNLEKLLADNPRASELIQKQSATFINEQQREVRLGQFLRTGHDPESGVSMPSMTRWSADMERLDRQRYQIMNDGLLAATEINNRKWMDEQGASAKQAPDPERNRYHFPNSSLEQLEAIRDRMMADPQLADLANRSWQIRTGQLEMAKKHGFITEADANMQATRRPHYLPESDAKGAYVSDFNKKYFNPRGGVEKVPTKATALWSQQVQKLHHDIEMNNFHRSVVDHIMNAQDKTRGMVPILTKLDRKPARPRDGNYIRVRRSTGEDWYHTPHTGVYEMLSGLNVDRARIHFDSMGKAKQLLHAGTTGAASLATGRIVPLRNLLFTAFQAPINATGGVYGGPVSMLTNNRLPKALTAPFDMPLNVVGGLATWANGAGKRLALHASDVFRPENTNFMTQTIRGFVGDEPLRNFSNALYDHYMMSDFYAGHSRGLGGQSLQQRVRAPTLTREGKFFNWKDDEVVRLQMAKLVPRIVIDMDAGVAGRHARPFLIKLQEAVVNEFSHASEATHDFLYSLNKNNPAFHGDPNQAVHAVRNIVGDPSVSGGGAAAQWIRTAVPYSNVIAQGTRAAGRAIATNPVDTLAAMVTGYGSLVALGMLTAFQSDENLEHFTKETSAQDRAKFLHIYNGPHGEKSLIRIPYPGESGWFTPLITEGMYHLTNIAGAPHDEEIRSDILGFLKNFLFHHIDTTTAEGMKHGLNDAFNFLDIPPYIKLGMTAVGGSGRIDFARMLTDYQAGNFGLNSIVNAPRQPGALPNQTADDAAAHGQNGKRWIEMAGSLFGLSQNIVQHLFNLDTYMRQGNTFMDSLGGVSDDWKQMTKDLNPMGNTLVWDNATLLSKVPPIVEVTRRRLHEMEKTRGARTTERLEGTTGGRNPLEIPVYETDQGKLPKDPTMQAMYTTTASYLQHLDRTIRPEISALERQLTDVSAKMHNPTERRAWVNNQLRIIADKYRYVDQEMIRLNDDLSEIARTRVDIGKGIDWQGDVSQFMR